LQIGKERKRRVSGSEVKDSKSSDSRGRVRSRSFEVTRRSDSRSNSAMRRTPKITNESVEKEIS
jgi:hypothetical protein